MGGLSNDQIETFIGQYVSFYTLCIWQNADIDHFQFYNEIDKGLLKVGMKAIITVDIGIIQLIVIISFICMTTAFIKIAHIRCGSSDSPNTEQSDSALT